MTQKAKKSEEILAENSVEIENEILENLSEVSDEKLYENLSDFNLENLISKSDKNKRVWKKEFICSFAENEVSGRNKIRKLQLKKSKVLLTAILTKQPKDEISKLAKELQSFYLTGLENFSNFTNISERENPEKYKTVRVAYEKMKLFI